MKKIALALAFAAASFVSAPASAQSASPFYVSGHLGMGKIDIDCEDARCDRTNAAIKVLGGYQFGNGFAAELGYATYGKLTWTEGVDSGKVTVGGFHVGGAYHAALGGNWGLTARVGVARLKAKFSVDGDYSESDTSTVPYFGIAGTYALDKNLKLEAGLDVTRPKYFDEKADALSLNIGARFSF